MKKTNLCIQHDHCNYKQTVYNYKQMSLKCDCINKDMRVGRGNTCQEEENQQVWGEDERGHWEIPMIIHI